MKLSTTYRVQAGDTFARIARRVYGSDTQDELLRRANPGISDPPTPGAALVVPDLDPPPISLIDPQDEDAVTVVIDGEQFSNWTRIALGRNVDSVRAISLAAPFDPADPELRELFRPFAYRTLAVFIGRQQYFDGFLMPVAPNLRANENTIELQGYSRAGVLWDCTPPISALPLEFNGWTLPRIAESLAAPFGIPVEIDADTGAEFPQVACRLDRRVGDFLADLGRQRGIIFSDSGAGALVGTQAPATASAVDTLRQGSAPLSQITTRFMTQMYYSHITAISPVDTGTDGAQFTVRNPHLPQPLRPLSFKAGDTPDGSTQTAAAAKLGRMFGNMVVYQVEVAKWRALDGQLWDAGQTVKVQAPGVMIYDDYDFIVSSVELVRTDRLKVARLGLVLPGSYRGEVPQALPWD